MKNIKDYLEEYKVKWIIKTSSWEDENWQEGIELKYICITRKKH